MLVQDISVFSILEGHVPWKVRKNTKITRVTLLNVAPSSSDEDPELLNLVSLDATRTAFLVTNLPISTMQRIAQPKC